MISAYNKLFNPLATTFSFLNLFLLIAFYIFLLMYHYQIKRIWIKEKSSNFFLSKNIKIDDTFFDTFNNKFKKLIPLFIVFIVISIPLFFISLSFVTRFHIDILKAKVTYFIYLWWAALGFSIAVFSISLFFIKKMNKVKKEFNQWKINNSKLDGLLFENIQAKENIDLLNKFKFSDNLDLYIIVRKRDYYLTQKYKIKNDNWKERFYKYDDKKLSEEFYYFLIFNYDDVAIDMESYTLEECSYVYQNRNYIFDR
ncbi:Hypothetical protein, predicted transmembrane protein [Metamycoplasma auris 15026]|uniref:Transmembrane protein n=1 Tax=Metamycoplasma auris 15026 TaxID=1188233 RepID=N9UZM7_9BACT|nr:hypothetical protein [Metamycoplasma auris]ENY68627.1 Hypothetical protein, predicted transmembrane protein [Metamycoplasma auris 15026]